MKSTTKTLLASALAIACASGVYAQAGGGGGTGGGPAGTGNQNGAVGGPGAGASPDGSTLNTPSKRHQMRSNRDKGGYGSPGATGMGAGNNSTMQRRDTDDQNPDTSGGTYGPKTPQNQPGYQKGQE
jgi:hypothetical protein